MTAEVFKEMLNRKPFAPFRVCLGTGESYNVEKPHTAAMMKSKAFIAIPNSEKWVFVSYLHIAALEVISNGHSNGKGRKRKR